MGHILKNFYYNSSKFINRNNNRNNNYILINHLLLNDINIIGNDTRNITDKNLDNPKNNGNIINDNYNGINETNINCVNMDVNKKISFYKTKKNIIIVTRRNSFQCS